MGENPVYPSLKRSVRIKKLPTFCWLINIESDRNQSIMPVEAFLLALCDGRFDAAELAYLMRNILGASEKTAQEAVENAVDAYRDCLDMLPVREHRRGLYDPGSFIYRIRDDSGQSVFRCETPCEIYFSLTRACNFQCIYCFNASGAPMPGELRGEEWLDLVSQSADMGVVKCTLTGGEPLLHPDFHAILRRLGEKDMAAYICTNGSLLDEDAASRIAEHGAAVVQVSLDTADPIVNRLLTRADMLDRVLSGITALRARDVPVHVKCVLTPLNIDGLPELVRMCNERDVAKLVIDMYDMSPAGRGDAHLLVVPEKPQFS